MGHKLPKYVSIYYAHTLLPHPDHSWYWSYFCNCVYRTLAVVFRWLCNIHQGFQFWPSSFSKQRN